MRQAQLARIFLSRLLAPAFCNLRELGALSLVGIITISDLAIAPAPARASQLVSWEFDPYTNELQVTVPNGTTPRYFVIAQPPRIVLDIPNSEMGMDPIQKNYPGVVRQIRIGQPEPGITRIVMDLSPNMVIEPAQVELQPVGQGNRWRLRPLISVSETIPRVETSNAVPTPKQSRSGTLPILPQSAVNQPPAVNVPTLEPARANMEPMVTVPPLQPPRTNQIPLVTVPPLQPPRAQNSQVVTVQTLEPAQAAIAPTPAAKDPYVPAAAPETPAVSVQKEQLPSEAIASTPNPPAEETASTSTTQAPAAPAATAPPSQVVVEFGQPLPVESGVSLPDSTSTTVSPDKATSARDEDSPRDQNKAISAEVGNIPSDVLIAAGTFLVLSYPGSAELTLERGGQRQEVLLVYSDIYDIKGNLIVPVGTPVIGRFESDRKGSRFIAQSIILEGRSLPISAESEFLTAERSPKTATIQPGQVLPVRLTEHWR